MKRYMPFIKFLFSHNYYRFSKCKDIELLIYEGKTIAERNYELILHKNNHGEFTLLIDTNDNFEERLNFLVKDVANGERISFLLKSKNEHLQTYTRDTNSKANLELRKQEISIDTKVTIDFKLTELKKTTGNSALEKDIFQKHPKSFLYLTLNTSETNAEELKERITHDKPLIVNIQLDAKSVVWKYILLPRTYVKQKLSIIDSKQLIHFSDIDWSESSKSRQIGIAYSKTEIPFSESYSHRPQLWKLHTKGKSLLIEDLSTPNIAQAGNFSYEKNYVSIYQYI